MSYNKNKKAKTLGLEKKRTALTKLRESTEEMEDKGSNCPEETCINARRQNLWH